MTHENVRRVKAEALRGFGGAGGYCGGVVDVDGIVR